MAHNSTEAEACRSGTPGQSIPQWKKELIVRRRALSRTLQVGSSSVKLTCPAVVSNVIKPATLAESVIIENKSGDEVSSAGARNSCSSLNRDGQPQDFHPSSSSSDSVPFGNMRLLDLDACSEVNSIAINGTDVKSKLVDVSDVNSGVYNSSIMGEGNIIISNPIKNAMHAKRDQNNSNHALKSIKKSVHSLKKVASNNEESRLKQKDMCFPCKDDDCLSDSSEELQYGPGIVSKLKTKYMSMTLREQKRSRTRPSIINLRRATSLENMLEGEADPSPQILSANEASLETRSDPVSKVRTVQKNKPSSNHHVTRRMEHRGSDRMKRARSMDTLLKSDGINSSLAVPNVTKADLGSERLLVAPFVNENVIILEQNSHQQPSQKVDIDFVPTNKELPPPDVVKQTLKIFETSPKIKVRHCNLVKPLGLPKTSIKPVVGNPNDIQKIGLNKPALSPKPSPEKIRQNRTRVNTCQKKCQKNLLAGLNNRVPDVPSSSAVFAVKNNNLASVQKQPAASADADSDNLDETDNHHEHLEPFTENSTKPVLESALENIRKGGVSMHFSFRSDANSSKSHLPRQSVNTPQAVNTSLLHQKYPLSPVSVVAPLRSHTSSPQTKQVGIIRPLVSTKTQAPLPSTPSLTEQEIEKNLINRVKSIEQPNGKVVIAIKGLPDDVVLGSLSSDLCPISKTKTQGLWDDKHQLWNQNQNTIVFNFSDRKEVPDYIENDGIILKGKRDRPVGGEAGEDGSEEGDDEEWGADVITVVGGNVLINGRSSLQKCPKLVKLRIKFDDGATTTFEYPSEASLEQEAQPDTDTGGGRLGTYTPRKMGADWQLGAEPVAPAKPPPPHPPPEDDHQQTLAWSQDTASDLLF